MQQELIAFLEKHKEEDEVQDLLEYYKDEPQAELDIAQIRKRIFQSLRKVRCPCRTQDDLVNLMLEMQQLYDDIRGK